MRRLHRLTLAVALVVAVLAGWSAAPEVNHPGPSDAEVAVALDDERARAAEQAKSKPTHKEKALAVLDNYQTTARVGWESATTDSERAVAARRAVEGLSVKPDSTVTKIGPHVFYARVCATSGKVALARTIKLSNTKRELVATTERVRRCFPD